MPVDRGRSLTAALAAFLLGSAFGCGHGHEVGGGIGVISVHVGGRSRTTTVPVAGVRLWTPGAPGGALLVADLQPLPARNPVMDESISSLFLLPSLQLTPGRRVALRAGAGPSLHAWSGPDAFETFSWGVAAGVSVEVIPRPEAERPWAVEAMARWAGGGEVSGSLFAVQVLRYLRPRQ